MTDWKNIPDDELDEILRKSAESYAPPFDEAAWKELSDKLTGKTKIRSTRTVIYLLTGLFLAALLIFFITRDPTPVSETGKTAVAKAQPGKNESAAVRKTYENSRDKAAIAKIYPGQKESNRGLRSSVPPLENIKSATVSADPGKKRGKRNTGSAKLPLESLHPAAASSDDPEAHRTRLEEGDSSGNRSNRTRFFSPSNNLAEGDSSGNSSNPTRFFSPSDNLAEGDSSGNSLRNNGYEKDRKPALPAIYPLTPIGMNRLTLNLPRPEVSPHRETPARPPRQRGLGLRLLYSPDFSTIATNKILKVGSNAGLLGEYRFNKRWSVQTGVIKSLKYYNALPEQYASPYTPKNLKDIDATCDMLDIPLNVRFDVVNTLQHKWFAAAGATGYLMLKEKYSYNYTYSTSSKKNGWEGKTGFYPFGVVNLSAGYERRLFKNFTIQAEPFFKIPVRQVGYGNVKLVTFGLFISGKIEFPTQPKPGARRIAF